MKLGFRGLLLAVVAGLVMMILTACSGVKLPGIYRQDLQQGNVITEEMLSQVELGMDRRRVRFFLGTPLLTDPFNQDRWDYVYSFKKGGGDRVQRRITLLFENDALVRIEGDVRSGTAAEDSGLRNDTVVTVPAERRKEGFFAALVPEFMKTGPAKSTAPAKGVQSATAVATVGGSEDGATAAEGGGGSETITEEDRADLEKLFGDFGRLGGDADEPAAPLGPAPRQESEAR